MDKSEKKKCRGVDKSAPRYFFSGSGCALVAEELSGQ